MSFRSGLIRVGRNTQSIFRPATHRSRPGAYTFTLTPTRRLASLDDSARTRIDRIARKLRALVRSNQLAEIHKTYPALVENFKRAKIVVPDMSISSPLDKRQFTDILDALAASGRPFDLALVEKILSDMSDVFGLTPTTDDHTAIIHALIRHGNVQTIQGWISSMPRKPGHLNPSLQHWHLFLEYCRRQGELGSLRAAIKSMRKFGCKPTNSNYKVLIDALFESPQHIPQLADLALIMDEMKQERLSYDQSILDALHRGYANHSHHQRAIQVERMYVSLFPPVHQGKRNEAVIWLKRLEKESHKHGAKAAVKLCKIFQQEGFIAPPFTMTTILQNTTNLNDLYHAEKELGLQASVFHWSILVRNIVRGGDINGALAIYHESQKCAVVPDAVMVHPIIAALCSTALKPPDEADIDKALALYQDLIRASSMQPQLHTSSSSQPTHSSGPDANIYDVLLRAISSSANLSKYRPITMSLLDDMQARGLSLASSMATTSLTILLMRNASSPSEAFGMYRRMRGKEGCNIDAKGYAVLLNAFCKLSFGAEAPIPSLQYYFEIVKDMRRSGHDVTIEVYTILLRQLASLASRITVDKAFPEHLADDLVAAVRRAHDHLTVDASISPDTAIWNQLMDTYQRAGCFGEAYRVWEMMYLSGTFDNASVSIILDACGYAGAWPVAAQICLKLLKSGFSFNQKNWNAWLECLCRLGKLDEAAKIVCLEMGYGRNGVAPDEETIRILLKFATKTNQQSEIQSRIKRYLPDLWQNLPPDLRDHSS